MLEIIKIEIDKLNLINDIIEINSEELKDRYITFENLCYVLEDGKQIILVAIKDEKVVGFLHCNCCAFDNTELLSIAVKKEHRGQGIAKRMIAFLLNKLKRQNIQKIFLEVASSNTNAKILYEEIGFIQYSKRSKYYDNGDDAICMCLHIK